jgi:CPA2 family monovalent cation:H+ antiporter-2
VELGAQLVIHPELEGGLEVVRHTLLRLGLPLRDIQKHVDAVRRESYVTGAGGDDGHRVLHRLLEAAQNLEVVWVAITESSPFSGRTLAQTELRARTGASIVAIERGGSLMPSPAPDTTLRPGDRLGLIGKPEDIEAGERLLSSDGASGPREG